VTQGKANLRQRSLSLRKAHTGCCEGFGFNTPDLKDAKKLLGERAIKIGNQDRG
jgi:hypothetical protein